jgi:hypothetical protein
MGKSFYHEHLFLLKLIINSHQYKYIYNMYVCTYVCIYNLHLIVRSMFKSKNEMGSHVVTRGQVAETGNGMFCSLGGGGQGTQSE